MKSNLFPLISSPASYKTDRVYTHVLENVQRQKMIRCGRRNGAVHCPRSLSPPLPKAKAAVMKKTHGDDFPKHEQDKVQQEAKR